MTINIVNNNVGDNALPGKVLKNKEVRRIRLFVNNGGDTLCKGFVNPINTACYVRIQYADDCFTISIDDAVKEYILSKALSSGFI